MGTYKIDNQIVSACNLQTAIEKLGFTNIDIHPLWYGKSNGKYKAYVKEKAIIICYWIEKRIELNLKF